MKNNLTSRRLKPSVLVQTIEAAGLASTAHHCGAVIDTGCAAIVAVHLDGESDDGHGKENVHDVGQNEPVVDSTSRCWLNETDEAQHP